MTGMPPEPLKILPLIKAVLPKKKRFFKKSVETLPASISGPFGKGSENAAVLANTLKQVMVPDAAALMGLFS